MYVSQRTCQRCSLKAACLKDGRQRQRVYLHPDKDRNRPKGIRLAIRVRKVIERVFAEAKKWHHLGRARDRGRPGVAFQAVMTFLVTNTKRTAAWSGVDRAWQGA